jgi:hypothetical protein
MKYSIKYTPINTTKGTDISFEQVENLYIGNGNQCRCGCGGEYYEASDEFNASIIKDALKKMASGKYAVESIDDYIFEIVIRKERTFRGKNKVMTLYLKK